ncbi:MAG: hypothetical protein WC827_00680 [Candidatus Paceibacterota bacterium]
MTKIKKEISSENLESQKYLELQEAQNEEDRIMDEIAIAFSSISDRSEAEKIVLEKWIPLMDKARDKTAKAMSVWHKIMDEKNKGKGEGLDIMNSGLDI